MTKNLDHREIESVLAHELGHMARHDYLMTLLATMLRDAFFYLPTSWAAYRELQADKELACDDLAVSVTQRPLALASALAKVWQQSFAGSPLGVAQPLAEAGMWIEQRIERLVEGRPPGPCTLLAPRPQSGLAHFGASALAGLLALQAATLIVMLVHPFSCGPGSAFGRMV
jgi:Zn-dependent protease with chaperone function